MLENAHWRVTIRTYWGNCPVFRHPDGTIIAFGVATIDNTERETRKEGGSHTPNPSKPEQIHLFDTSEYHKDD
jgi:hypothetical protein